MERYVLINGFDNYAISDVGNVRNVKRGRNVALVERNSGYLVCSLCQNGIKKTFSVHRLVAIHFIKNPNNLPCVNHKDGNKKNNCVSNLEWCTAKENDTHARTTGLKDQNKPIVALDTDNGNSFVFSSLSEAGAILGINKGTICKVLKGKRKQVHGFTFYYLTDIT